MSIPSYSFNSLPLKLLNKGMDFLFPPLILPKREEYSKIILFIHFYSISFPPPKRGHKKIHIDTFRQTLITTTITKICLEEKRSFFEHEVVEYSFDK